MKKYLASKFVSFHIDTITDIKEVSKNGILRNNGIFTPCETEYDKIFDTYNEAKQWLIACATNGIVNAKERVTQAEARLEKVMNLEEPDE